MGIWAWPETTEKQRLEGQEGASPAEGHSRQRRPQGQRPHGWKEPRVLKELKGGSYDWRRQAGSGVPERGQSLLSLVSRVRVWGLI